MFIWFGVLLVCLVLLVWVFFNLFHSMVSFTSETRPA